MLALLDSGATDNFISPDVVEHFKVPTRILPAPRTIRNVDGTRNSIGSVTKTAQMWISYNNKTHLHNFYVVELGADDMLLGMPFFAATNPKINWTAGTFHGKVTACTTDSHKWSYNRDRSVIRPFMLRPQDISLRMPWEEPVRAKRTTKSTELAITTHEKEILEGFRLDPTNEYRHREYKKLVPGSFDAFKRSREPPKEPEDNWRDFIPKEYHQYAKVFSSHAAMRFPNPRPWDHEIELLSDAPQTLNCKVYPLPPCQQKALDEFLNEHLKKGYIRRSNSPYASPFFFIKKKDGKLRPV